MKNLSFNNIKIGMTYRMKKKINYKILNQFIEFSGDINPLHQDYNYAKKRIFKYSCPRIFIYFFLFKICWSLFTRKKCLLISNKTNFKKPIYPNSVLNYVGKVINKNIKYKILDIKINIFVNKSLCVESVICVNDMKNLYIITGASSEIGIQILLKLSKKINDDFLLQVFKNKNKLVENKKLNKLNKNIYSLNFSLNKNIQNFISKINKSKKYRNIIFIHLPSQKLL